MNHGKGWELQRMRTIFHLILVSARGRSLLTVSCIQKLKLSHYVSRFLFLPALFNVSSSDVSTRGRNTFGEKYRLKQMQLSPLGLETSWDFLLGGCWNPYAAQTNFVSEITHMPRSRNILHFIVDKLSGTLLQSFLSPVNCFYWLSNSLSQKGPKIGQVAAFLQAKDLAWVFGITISPTGHASSSAKIGVLCFSLPQTCIHLREEIHPCLLCHY